VKIGGLTTLDRRRNRREDSHWKGNSMQWERLFEWATNEKNSGQT